MYVFTLEEALVNHFNSKFKEDIKMEYTKENLKNIINKFIKDNEDNKIILDTKYDYGYYDGYHDAFVDMLHRLEIPTDEEYHAD